MFYAQVKGLCDKNNVKITSLARKLKLSPSAPNNWQSGSLPKAETIIKIAEFFDVSTDYLLKGENGGGISNTSNSVVLQGNTGNNTVSNGAMTTEASKLTEQEEEVLRIFRSLDMRNKAATLIYLYELSDKANS